MFGSACVAVSKLPNVNRILSYYDLVCQGVLMLFEWLYVLAALLIIYEKLMQCSLSGKSNKFMDLVFPETFSRK
jgi:hypothetical protein